MMPCRIVLRLKRLLLAYLLVTWGVAWATIEHTQPDLAGLPWAQALIGVGVAWLGGFAATLGRRLTAIYDNKPFNLHYEFTRDGAVSSVIGMGGYFGGMESNVGPAMLALILVVSGYAGTRTLAVWVDKLIKPIDTQ